ncbi:MAG: MBL fold metallo-hydrolase [Thermogutta sp.]
MQLTIYRGTHEIGGSCIEIATDNTRVILDVGLPLVDADRAPFDPTSIRGKSVEDLIAAGTVPRVPGLFTDGTPPAAILLSHNHLDHTGLLHLTDSGIPVYASSGTSKMMLASAVFSWQHELDRTRHREVVSGRPFEVGDLRVTAFAVDHSSFGSMAFLVEGEGKTILYSGDIRNHGRKPGMMRDLLAAAKKQPVDVLVMEGTHFGPGRAKGPNEHELQEEIERYIKSARALVLATFSPIDVDRLVTYYKATQRAGKTLVVDGYAAFILHLVSSEAGIPRPTREAGIRVYFNAAFQRKAVKKLEDQFAAARIELDEVLGAPARHVMVFRPSMTDLDFGGTLPRQSRVMYSYWKGYLEREQWRELQDHVKAVDGDFIAVHASGHIYRDDLIAFVRQVSPQIVVPCHTFAPDAFGEYFPNVRVLQDGEAYQIS